MSIHQLLQKLGLAQYEQSIMKYVARFSIDDSKDPDHGEYVELPYAYTTRSGEKKYINKIVRWSDGKIAVVICCNISKDDIVYHGPFWKERIIGVLNGVEYPSKYKCVWLKPNTLFDVFTVLCHGRQYLISSNMFRRRLKKPELTILSNCMIGSFAVLFDSSTNLIYNRNLTHVACVLRSDTEADLKPGLHKEYLKLIRFNPTWISNILEKNKEHAGLRIGWIQVDRKYYICKCIDGAEHILYLSDLRYKA